MVQEIPRFRLIDENGKIVGANEIRPTSSDIKT